MQREERIYERRAAAQDGRRLRLEYCRLETPDENTTSFGAAIRCVSDGSEDYAALPDITSSPERIMQLLTQLADGAVTPVSLREIVEDWL